MNPKRYDAAGIVVGLIVAGVALIIASVALLAPEGTSAKVLIAVWLWSLPVVGICTGIGMAIGRFLGRIVS